MLQLDVKLFDLQVPGEFRNHNNYDGMFIGIPNLDWHFEFTVYDEVPIHEPDLDDLLVFDLNDKKKLQTLLNNRV